MVAVDCLSAMQPLQEVRQIEQPKFAALPAGYPATNQIAFERGPPDSSRAVPMLLPHASIQQRYCTYLK